LNMRYYEITNGFWGVLYVVDFEGLQIEHCAL